MHDVDRTIQEASEFGELDASQEYEGEGEEFLGDVVGGLLGGEYEGEGEGEGEGFLGDIVGGLLGGEYEGEGFLGEGEYEGESAPVFDEVTEMELASELLGVQSEEELEQFLGGLIKKAGKFVGNIANSPVGKALGGIAKKAAKVALPAAGAALGNLVLPGVGGAIGGKLASAAGNMFGLEFEGLSPQDREFEAAKRVVRFTGTAAKKLSKTPTHVPPAKALKAATIVAARKHIPGLLRPKVVANISHAVKQAHAARPHTVTPVRPTHPSHPIHRHHGAHRRGTYGAVAAVGAPTYGGAPTYAGPMFGAGYVAPSIETPSYVGSTNGSSYTTPVGFTRTGRWYRRGRKIVLVGV